MQVLRQTLIELSVGIIQRVLTENRFNLHFKFYDIVWKVIW